MTNRFSASGRVAGFLVGLSVLALGGLVGAAAPGQAATAFDVELTPLIGTTSVNQIGQVTFGGNVGYHLLIENTGKSTTRHVKIVVTSDSATFLDTDDSGCVPGSSAGQVVCTPPGATLRRGDTFEANFRFTAPTSGTQVSTFAAISIAAKTVGGASNNGTTLAESSDVLTNLVANGAKKDTFLRETESAATGPLAVGHPQNFGVQLPATLLGNPFGIGVSMHDEPGSICVGCLNSHTVLSIPKASLVSLSGNPFYDGTNVNPYTWTTSAEYSGIFTLTRLVHIDDNNISHDVPSCASIGGAPTPADPLCWDTLVQDGMTMTVSASGRGLENGKIGFG